MQGRVKCSHGPDTGSNPGGGQIQKKTQVAVGLKGIYFLFSFGKEEKGPEEVEENLEVVTVEPISSSPVPPADPTASSPLPGTPGNCGLLQSAPLGAV